jgi:hypothetical protein
MSDKFTHRVIGKTNLPLILATVLGSKIWFEVAPHVVNDEPQYWDVSVKAEDAELLKRIVLVVGEVEDK